MNDFTGKFWGEPSEAGNYALIVRLEQNSGYIMIDEEEAFVSWETFTFGN